MKDKKVLKIAIIGRARVGKSFITSLFVKSRTDFREAFCGNGADKTICPVRVVLNKEASKTTVHAHLDTSHLSGKTPEIFKAIDGSPLYNVDEYADNNTADSTSLNLSYVEAVEAIDNQIRTLIDASEDGNIGDTYIETHQVPSDYCANIMAEHGLDTVEIVDMPGVSGNIKAIPVAKSDLYLFVLRPENSDDAKTLRAVVETIKNDISDSCVAFLYKSDATVLYQADYELQQKSASNGMRAFDKDLEGLKSGSVIHMDTDVLNPSGSCILFPPMHSTTTVPAEELFLEALTSKIEKAIIGNDKISVVAYKRALECIPGSTNFLINLLAHIPAHKLRKADNEYTLNDFANAHHDRVKTGDYCRIHSHVLTAYYEESNLLNEYFKSFSVPNYSEHEQIVIKYVYHALTSSVRQDRGLGYAFYANELRPPITMLAEESIIADKLLYNLNNPLLTSTKSASTIYIETLKSYNISSKTWDYVSAPCTYRYDGLTKLRIIRNSLSCIKAFREYDLVLCRYIGGLRKLAQYQVLVDAGITEQESMEIVNRLQFAVASDTE